MREIKFRAYHKKDKLMLDWFTLIQSAWNTYAEGQYFCLFYEVLITKKDYFNVMQYTELKDKNGKEIYEGDILGGHGKDHPLGEYKAVVIWNEKKGEWYLDKAYCSGQRNLWRWCDGMEVIGNIYENKELL